MKQAQNTLTKLLRNTHAAIACGLLGAVIVTLASSTAAHAAQATMLSATYIRGATVYSPLQFLPTYQNSLGQPITQAGAESIISAIEAMYARDGYSRPEMQLDIAQLQYGILGIDIFETQITQVIVAGEPGPYRDRLTELASELRAQHPTRPQTIQDVLRRMRRLPGLLVEANFQRDTTARNAYVLKVDTEFDLIATKLRVTNRGTRDVGRNFLIGESVANGLWGRDLKVGLLFGLAQQTQEFRGAGIFMDTAWDSSDTRSTLLGFRSYSSPTEHPVNMDVDYRHDRVTAGISHRWQSQGSWELTSAATVELDDMFIEFNGAEYQSDRLRIVDLGQTVSHSSNTAQYVAMFTVRQGVDGLGAGFHTIGSGGSRPNDFNSLRLQFIRLARLGKLWLWRIDALGQYSKDVLADRERFKIGGDRLGRGFEVPAIAGDQGMGGKLELRRELPGLSSRVGELSVYSSYDIGMTRTNDQAINESAATAGLGMTLQGKRTSGYLELARPLTRADVDGRRTTTLFVDLSVNF